MPSTTVTDAIVFPQDPGTGIASQNDPPSGGLWALHNQHVSGSGGYLINADQGSIDLTVDAANDEVTLGAGACYIAESGGSVSVQESVGDTYGVGLPASVEIVYVVVLPTDVTVGLDVDATNDIYLSLDPTTRNSVTVTTGNGISAPADPSLFRGTVDSSAGSVVENANQYADPRFGQTTTDALEAETSITDPSNVEHTGELADASDVSSIQSSSDVDHNQTTNRTHEGDNLSPDTLDAGNSITDPSDVSHTGELADLDDTLNTSDVTSSNWGDYEIQKNGTDGAGIINFKTN